MLRKPTLRQQAQKEIRRLKRGVKAAEKRGFFLDNADVFNLPKRITRRKLEQLKAMKPADIYLNPKNVTAVDMFTGEILPPKVLRERQRSEAARRGAATRAASRPIRGSLETANTIELVKNRIETMERQLNKDLIDLDPIKQQALSTINDNELENAEEYAAYLAQQSVQSEISESIYIIEFEPSDEDRIFMAAARLMELLNMGSLSALARDLLSDNMTRVMYE